MNLDLDKILNEVSSIARHIGGYLKNEQSKLKSSAIEMKGSRDYVSYVDKEAEKQLVEKLKEVIPEAGYLTEEETVEQEVKEYMWIIDPLDGTSNYVHGVAPYAVSIALSYKEKIILGVVYDPLADELYSAIEGKRATLNGEFIDVSSKDEIKNSFIGFGIPYVVNKETKSILKNIWEHFGDASFRINGSAAVELCYVACGRYDAYIHSGLSPWDVAAGAFILQQVNGKITDYNSGNNYIYGEEVVATNSLIHNSIMNNIINIEKTTN